MAAYGSSVTVILTVVAAAVVAVPPVLWCKADTGRFSVHGLDA